jgi:hypothetical protein
MRGAAQVNVSSIKGEQDMGPLCLHCWASESDMVHASVVVPFLPFCFEVNVGPSGDDVDDSMIWWFGEVFLLGCLGVVMVWWIWVMRRWWW